MTAQQGPTGHAPPQAGFTILELLVGLALFAILLSTIPGALQLGRRAWEDTAKSDRIAQVVGVRAFLEQRLAETMPVAERTGAGGRGIAFAGRRDSLMFVSPAPDGPGGAGIYRFEIGRGSQSESGGGSILMRQSLFAPDGIRGTAEDLPLLTGVDDYAFRYFGALRSPEGPSWHGEWPRSDVLPDLIELSVVLEGRNAPAFLPLVVAPRLR